MRLVGRAAAAYTAGDAATAAPPRPAPAGRAGRRPTGAIAPSPMIDNPLPAFLADPDPSFRLSAGERARIFPAFDADVVERLLQYVRPDLRALTLATFFYSSPGDEGTYLLGLPIERPEIAALLRQLAPPLAGLSTEDGRP